MTDDAARTNKISLSVLPYGVLVYQADDQLWSLAARFLLERDAWHFRSRIAAGWQDDADAVVVIFEDDQVRALSRPTSEQ